MTLNLLCICLGVWGNSPPNRRGRSPLALSPVLTVSLFFSLPLWLGGRQAPGSIFAQGENLHPVRPGPDCLTAAILPVLRLRRQREADVNISPPLSPCHCTGRTAAAGWCWLVGFAGRSPLHPPPLQKADGGRSRKIPSLFFGGGGVLVTSTPGAGLTVKGGPLRAEGGDFRPPGRKYYPALDGQTTEHAGPGGAGGITCPSALAASGKV